MVGGAVDMKGWVRWMPGEHDLKMTGDFTLSAQDSLQSDGQRSEGKGEAPSPGSDRERALFMFIFFQRLRSA